MPPSVTGVAPPGGTGLTQTFTFGFFDPDGASTLAYGDVNFSSPLSASNSCWVEFGFEGYGFDGLIFLANDAGTVWLGPEVIGSPTAGILENSQCVINPAASTLTKSGTDATLQLAVTFKTGYSGSRTI